MDAIASGSTEVNANNLFQHFKKLTDLNGKGVEYLEDDFRVSSNLFYKSQKACFIIHPELVHLYRFGSYVATGAVAILKN